MFVRLSIRLHVKTREEIIGFSLHLIEEIGSLNLLINSNLWLQNNVRKKNEYRLYANRAE